MANPMKKMRVILDEHDKIIGKTPQIKSIMLMFKYAMSEEFCCYLFTKFSNRKLDIIALCNVFIAKADEMKTATNDIIGDDSEELHLLCDEVNEFYSAKLVELHNN